MPAPIPPPSARRAFWVLGRRLAPEHRPWVAEQITAPDYARRRMRSVLGLQVVLIVLPQLLLAVTVGSRLNLGVAAVTLVAFVVVAAVTRRGLTSTETARLLAHHGVTAGGEVVPPTSAWDASWLSPAAAGLLVVLLVVLISGIVVVADRYLSPDRCRVASDPEVAAVEALLGRTMLQGGPPSPPLFEGARLERAQRVETGLEGVSYVAAEVRGTRSAGLVGPAVWRVIVPGGVFPVTEVDVSAADQLARALTPVAGYSTSTPPDRLVQQAHECAREAARG